LATPRRNKLAFSRRNTRQNPDGEQITPVTDPEKILKARGSFKPTAAVYQLAIPSPKAESPSEPSTSFSPCFDAKHSTPICSEIRSEIHPTVPLVQRGEGPLEGSSAFKIPSYLQLNFPTSPNPEECVTHSFPTPVGFPDSVSCKSEEPTPRVPYPSSSESPLSEENKNSLLFFENPLYNFPQTTMAAAGGGGGGFIGGGGGFGGGGGGVPLGGGGGGVPLGGGGGQGPPPPPRVFAKVAARYAPLVLPVPLHDLPENYIKNLPKFTGEGDLTAAEHINFFDQFADIFGIEHEDVYSRLLVQTFEGQVRTWFRSLPAASIPSYDALEDAFLRQWGERKDHLYYLTEFGSLKKKNSETVMEFILRFNKLYNKIPAEVKPSQPAAKVTFAGAFEPDFALLLRERRGATLNRMQDDAVEIESNMMASGKLKARIETGNRETKRFREQAGPSGSNRSSDDRVDDMARVIKELSNKITRMELEQAKADSYPKKDFRKNQNPPNQQRQIKKEDQKIQAPLKNENFIGANDFQDFEDSDNDVTNFGDDCSQPYLTREDYEKSLNVPQSPNESEEGDHTEICESQPETEIMMADFQPKYNLRSKNKPTSTIQPKKILQRGQAYEPPSDETPLPNNKTRRVSTQEPEVEKVGTQTQESEPVNEATSSTKTMNDKAVQTNKSERKNSEVSTRETDKVSGAFSFENELNKIKIPIPLVELAKNPCLSQTNYQNDRCLRTRKPV
jgi:hypothetical protein